MQLLMDIVSYAQLANVLIMPISFALLGAASLKILLKKK